MNIQTIRSYDQLDQFLTRNGRKIERRKLERNTYAIRPPHGYLTVRYHDTDIVVYAPDGTVTIDAAGWYSRNTLERLNNYTPVTLSIRQVTVPSRTFERQGYKLPAGYVALDTNSHDTGYISKYSRFIADRAAEADTPGMYDYADRVHGRLERQYWQIETSNGRAPYVDGLTLDCTTGTVAV